MDKEKLEDAGTSPGAPEKPDLEAEVLQEVALVVEDLVVVLVAVFAVLI